MLAKADIEAVLVELKAYHSRFHSVFVRSEPREQAEKYMAGLISATDRRNGWQLAEAAGDSVPDPTQRLLNHAKWDPEAARDEHLRFCTEEFGGMDGVFLTDETGFLKKGNKSAGVKRQYSGTAGKTENCQIGVFLGYSSARGRVLLDRRLYLPKEWCSDANRRLEARIPDEVAFQTKPAQALEMLEHAVAMGVPGEWVAGDEVYGNDPKFRDGAAALGLNYVLAVNRTISLWKEPVSGGPGRTSLSFWPSTESLSAEFAARNLPQRCWRKMAVRVGEKGPIYYQWGAVRVCLDKKRTQVRWLLIRRSMRDRDDMAFYLSNAGPLTTIKTLARIAATRFEIELCFEEAKGECGLDEYEVRLWPAWYRHITLSMMAQGFLAAVKKTRNTTAISGHRKAVTQSPAPQTLC